MTGPIRLGWRNPDGLCSPPFAPSSRSREPGDLRALARCGADMLPSRQSAIEPSHVDAIDALAAETHRSPEEVAEVYVRELARLRAGARIENYLVLLTSRHVREALRGLDRRRFRLQSST